MNPLLTEQECLDFIKVYLCQAVTKYYFELGWYPPEGAALPESYASLNFALRDDSVKILESGCCMKEALNNLVTYLKHPSNQHYKTTDFTLPEYNHD
jgi:hypothetical protein